MFTRCAERRRTNTCSIVTCALITVTLLVLIIYCAANGSIFRITNGIDDCGYICGRDNKFNDLSSCKSPDKRQLPITKVDINPKDVDDEKIKNSHSECVKDCNYPGYVLIANRCWKVGKNSKDYPKTEEGSILTNVVEDLSVTWPSIPITCILAMFLSFIVLILFRYAIKYVIWIIQLAILCCFVIIAVKYLILFSKAKSSSDPEVNKNSLKYGSLSAIFALLAIVFAIILLIFRKRIILVAQLFKETSKVLIDIPLIVFEPILTFVAIGLSCTAFFFFIAIIESSGHLKVLNNADGSFNKAIYEKNIIMKTASVFNFVGFIWFTFLIIGCQNFVIASTVSQWFFSRSKSRLDWPIKRAFSHLLRFHIGSICLGSMIITIIKIIRMIVESFIKKSEGSGWLAIKLLGCCCRCIMKMMEDFLNYLTRNAYIIVALNGTPLIDSGKKAFRLITSHLVDVIALNKFGDFNLLVGKFLVTAICFISCSEIVRGYENINYPFVIITIGVILAFLIVHCFMTVFEMAIDTVFVCFCEDCEVNDGISKPFFMSRDLMKIMLQMKSSAGGNFKFLETNAGGEAGQPQSLPIGWKFGNENHSISSI